MKVDLILDLATISVKIVLKERVYFVFTKLDISVFFEDISTARFVEIILRMFPKYV